MPSGTSSYRIQTLEAITLKFYNLIAEKEVETVNDIPEDVAVALGYMRPYELARPFVIKDMKARKSRSQLSISYGLPEHVIRQIGIDAGIYEKK